MLDLVRRLALVSVPSLALGVSPVLSAQDLGGGAPASHGRVPRFVLESWIPGTASAVRLDDAPATLNTAVAVLSPATTALSLPGIAGTLITDPGLAVAFGFAPAGTSIGTIPATVAGTLFGQCVWIDGASGAGCTDASSSADGKRIVTMTVEGTVRVWEGDWANGEATLIATLEPEEGQDQARRFLAAHADVTADPIRAEEVPGFADAITAEGFLRTLPFQGPDGGADAFFVARFRKTLP